MDLLDAGKSLSSIARETGISHSTLLRVRRGYYWKNDDFPVEEVLSSGKKGRCTKCGHLVFLPCVACRIRELNADQT